MQLQALSPILWTKNLSETISFYETVLGFKSRSNFPNFASLCRDNAENMVIVPTGEPDDKDFFPKPLFNGSIYIFTKVLMNFGKLINPGLIMWLLSTGFLEVLRRDLPGNLLRDIVTKLSQQRWLKTID